jgi:surfeit locus 1 family protein
MRWRNAAFVVASLGLAALFARLGVWQLDRLTERRTHNALVSSRLTGAPVPLSDVPRDSARSHYLRVRLSGRYDFTRQILFVDRIRDGAPGVQIVTPLHPDSGMGGDTAVLVDRGWVYSPDGASIDESRWNEPEHVVATGYVQGFSPGRGPAVTAPDHPERFRWLDPAAAARRTGYPVFGSYVVLEGQPIPGATSTPVRVPEPPLDDGPHLSYAIQWFAFAAIALIGPVLAIYVIPRSHPRQG